MKIIRVVVGSLDANCYILVEDNKCLVIDPGGDSDRGSVVALVEGWEDPCSVDRVLFGMGSAILLFRDRLDLSVRILLRIFPHGFEECLCRNLPSRPSH